MDTSKEYIEMCEKAGEIQTPFFDKKVLPKEYVFFIKEKGKTIVFYDEDRVMYQDEGIKGPWFIEDTGVNNLPIPFTKFADNDFFYSYLDKESGLNFIWLPRQDQLQEMVKDNYDCVYDMNLDFTMWWQQISIAHKKEMSLEQLWLGFMMQEKYKKIWDGKNWIGAV